MLMRYHWGLGVGHVGMGSQINSENDSLEDIPLLPEVQSPDKLPEDLPVEEQDDDCEQDDNEEQDVEDEQDIQAKQNNNNSDQHEGHHDEDEVPSSKKHSDAQHDMFGDDEEGIGSYD